jgi:hypothetical protein
MFETKHFNIDIIIVSGRHFLSSDIVKKYDFPGNIYFKDEFDIYKYSKMLFFIKYSSMTDVRVRAKEKGDLTTGRYLTARGRRGTRIIH